MENTHLPEEKISPYTLGIDFGTSNSVVTVYKAGHVEPLEVDGKTVTPSVVSFWQKDSVLVGEQAKNLALVYPDKTVSSVKMKLGKSNWKLTANGRDYSAIDITALILNALKEGAQNQTNVDLEGTVKNAVICVPANFDAKKRRELKEAAHMVGFEGVSLLEEPVAAAIACADNFPSQTKILIYDFGGGTFDVCVLEVFPSAEDPDQKDYKVLSKEGVTKLGGDDFDQRIMSFLGEDIKASSGIDVFDLKKDQGINKSKLRQAQQKLKIAAEKAKKELAATEEVVINEPSIITNESGKSYGLNEFKLTQDKFRELTEDLVLRTKETVEKALQAASTTIDDIERIILVGGTTKAFMVKEMVEKMFERAVYADVDPATTVAKGAALYKGFGLKPVSLDNLTSHFLGVELLGQKFGKLIDKGIKIPISEGKVWEAVDRNPEAIRIAIFQSPEEIEYITQAGTVCLGEFFLVIPEEKQKEEYRKVNVKMTITKENTLETFAELVNDKGVSHAVEMKLVGE